MKYDSKFLDSSYPNCLSGLSVAHEAKEPLLVQLKEPWSYTMTGLLDGDYVLHKLPIPPSSSQDTSCARRIPKIFKRS